MKFLNEHLEACFIVPLMFLMSIIIFVQVVMRYVFHSSLTWSEEMARYLFVWPVYFSVAYTAKKEAHIRIDAAINIYPKKARPYVEILSEIIVLAFAIFIAVTSVTVFQKISASGQISPALHVPMQFVYAAPLVLTAIRQIQCIIRRIKALHNHEEVQEA